ncbi:MAG: IPTL-CTERM sorting domain-containing protein [Phycisphaerae bacterium]
MRKSLVLLAILAVHPAVAQDAPCSKCGPGPDWVDSCPAGSDVVANHSALVGIDLDLDEIADTNLVLGPCPGSLLEIDRSAPAAGVIDTEIVALCLSGPGGVTLRAGAGTGNGGALGASLGEITEDAGDNTIADSYFDVLFEVDLGGANYVYNHDPLRLDAVIDCVPPRIKYFHVSGVTALYNDPVGGDHVANLVRARHGLFQLEHFTVWDVVDVPVDFTVGVRDQFMTEEEAVHLATIDLLANPAAKNESPYDEDHHLLWYTLDKNVGECRQTVTVNNQFGEQVFELNRLREYVLVPARKDPHQPPEDLDHFLCYEVIGDTDEHGAYFIQDQFMPGGQNLPVGPARYFCNPVRKDHGGVVTPIEHPEDHLVFYDILNLPMGPIVSVDDQFVTGQALQVVELRYLGVPTSKDGVQSTDCIPTVSEWGVAVLTLLVLAAATVVLRQRQALAA